MHFSTKSLTATLCVLTQITGSNAWSWAAHNLIQAFGASAPVGLTTSYQPLLRVEIGCVPFPAIDLVDGGRAGAGLALGGAINGNCGSSPGQVYSRSGTFDGRYGIMYAWYFPKDQGPLPFIGHRHDWEGIVVWFASSTDPTLLAICAARHGTGVEDNHCDKAGSFKLQGTRPKILYRLDGTHALFTYSGTSGLGSHALIDWENLPADAKQIINEADFGSATAPFRESSFDTNMRNAKTAAGI